MSEFETNPEGLRAHQLEVENNLFNLNEEFAAIQLGDWKEKRTASEQEKIIALATHQKRELLKTLTSLGDFEEIANRLGAETFSQKQMYEDEGMPVYIDMVFEEVFGVELTGPNLHEDILKIVENVKKENDVQSFADEEAE